ncbi:MFS transporter [Candidatus Woesearchaeota archaeon]|nr:MFS transporter [Candidatus Woesearchaeota archaeon]
MSYRSNIWKMYLFKFFRNLHFIGAVLVPFYTDWGGISFTQIMILNSFFLISIFFMEIPTGAVADYFGRKASLILAALVTAVATFVYSLIPNFYMFLLGEFLWGAGYALMSGADEALVYDSLKKGRAEKKSKKIFARFNSFEIGAIMIAAPIGSAIAAYIGLRYTMMFMAFPMLIAAAVGITLKEPKTKKKVESARYINLLVGGVKYFKNHRELKILAFDRISIAIFVFMVIWIYQPLLKELNVPLVYFGFVLAGMSVVQVIFLNSHSILEKIFGSKKRYLLYSALISGALFILLGLSNSVPLTIIMLLAVASFGLTRHVLFQSYMNKYIESYNRATVISAISMIDRFCRALVYPLIGLIVEVSLRYAFFFLGAVIIVFALVSKVEEEHLID